MNSSYSHRYPCTWLAQLTLGLLAALAGCERTNSPTDNIQGLRFSTDTVRFDSVFAGAVSSTRLLRIYNKGRNTVRIPELRLLHGAASQFAMLVDGQSTTAAHGVEIEQGDSLTLAIRLKPSGITVDTIRVVSDSIAIANQGISRYVALLGKGLASTPLSVDTLRTDLTIAGPPALRVQRRMVIPKGVTLTLRAGASLYFSQGAGIDVYGSLAIEGTPLSPVVLAGERLETYYRRQPGQWQGINLKPRSGPHTLSYFQLRSAVTALRADSLTSPLSVRGATIAFTSRDGVVANKTLLALYGCLLLQNYGCALRMRAANVRLVHCTLYASSLPPQTRRDPLIAIEPVKGNSTPCSLLVANSILWGDRANELPIPEELTPKPEITCTHSVMKIPQSMLSANPTWLHVLLDNPKLTAPEKGNAQLEKNSPAIGQGLVEYGNEDPIDLQNQPRLQHGNPDIGALVFTPKP